MLVASILLIALKMILKSYQLQQERESFNQELYHTVLLDIRKARVQLSKIRDCFDSNTDVCKLKVSKLQRMSKNFYKKMRVALSLISPERGGDSYQSTYHHIGT